MHSYRKNVAMSSTLKRTRKLSSISTNMQTTWKNKIFITFDIDWACDEILHDTYSICKDAGICATFFATHSSPIIQEITKDPSMEVGIHPNFVPLLRHNNTHCSYKNVLDDITRKFPEAKSSRSHGVIQGGIIMEHLTSLGVNIMSNVMIPWESEIGIKPYNTVYNAIEAPFCWADEHEWSLNRQTCFASLFKKDHLMVIAFHPVHIFLNTPNQNFYNERKTSLLSKLEPASSRYTGEGTRTLFFRMLQTLQATNNLTFQ
jgi:hypothetical protein